MPITHDVVDRRTGAAVLDSAEGTPRPGVVKAGLALTYLAAATIPWTAVDLGGLSFGDLCMVLAAVTLVAADLRRPLPGLPPWAWALVLTVVVIGAVNHFAPVSQSYLAHRDQLILTSGGYVVVHSADIPFGNLFVMIHLLVRLVVLSFLFGLARGFDSRALSRSALALVGGTVICSLIAFTDSRGWTSIGPSLVGVPVVDGRASGLTDHPNVVAMSCVIALPLAVWQASSARGRGRLLAGLGLIALLLGLYASRSRSGAAAAAVAGAVSLGWLPQYRRLLPTIGFLLALIAAVLFAANPALGTDLLSGLRLTGGDTSGSDRSRSIVNDQGLRDFLHSPLRGIGLEIADNAHNVYLQALAVGGVILLAGLLIYLGGALVRSARLARIEPLAIPIFASILGVAIFNAAQNALTPSIAYIAPGLAAGLPALASSSGRYFQART